MKFIFPLCKVMISCLNFRWKPELIATCKIKQVGLGSPCRCCFLCNSFRVSLPSTSSKSPFLSGEVRAALCQITSHEIKGKYYGFLSPKSFLTVLYKDFLRPFCGFRSDDLTESWIFSIEQNHCLAWVTSQMFSLKDQIVNVFALWVIWILSQIDNSAAVTQKQPKTKPKWMGVIEFQKALLNHSMMAGIYLHWKSWTFQLYFICEF